VKAAAAQRAAQRPKPAARPNVNIGRGPGSYRRPTALSGARSAGLDRAASSRGARSRGGFRGGGRRR